MRDDQIKVLCGISAIARWLSLPPKVVQRLHENEVIPTFHLGRRVCARPSTLSAFLADREAEATRNSSRGAK